MGRRKSGSARLRIFRRALVAPYVAAALVLLPLALIRGCESPLRMDLLVRETSFELTGRSPLIDSGQYESLYIVQRATAEWRSPDGRTVRLQATPNGSIAFDRPFLTSLDLEPGARVTLARTDATDLTMHVERGGVTAHLSAPGRIIACDNCTVDGVAALHHEAVLDGPVTVRGDAGSFHMVLTRPGGVPLGDGVRIANPSFVSGTAENPVSSVADKGTISLTGGNITPIPLDRGDSLELRGARDLVIAAIAFPPAQDGLRVTMTGHANAVLVGGRNRLPSLLERLHANQALALYFTAVVFVAGTIVNVLRKLRVATEPK